jgi:hypothetical protein
MDQLPVSQVFPELRNICAYMRFFFMVMRELMTYWRARLIPNSSYGGAEWQLGNVALLRKSES